MVVVLHWEGSGRGLRSFLYSSHAGILSLEWAVQQPIAVVTDLRCSPYSSGRTCWMCFQFSLSLFPELGIMAGCHVSESGIMAGRREVILVPGCCSTQYVQCDARALLPQALCIYFLA